MKKNRKRRMFISDVLKKPLRIMRWSIFLFVLSIFQVQAVTGLAQKAQLSLDFKNVSIETILNEIETQSEFYFLYNKNLVDVKRKVDIQVRNQKLDVILNRLFENSDVDYMVIDRQIVLTNEENKLNGFSAQTQVVLGKVTDVNNVSLPGVTVVVKGTTVGTITDEEGNYSLSNVAVDATIIFSFIGMKTVEVIVGGKENVSVTMEEIAVGVDEVVVIGYGSRQKKDITTSISSVSAEEILKVSSMSPQMAMQGRMSGVHISGNSGNVMESPTVNIRGVNTWGDASPLYVIDGVPITGADNDIVIGSVINVLNMIDPNDIESMSVLKDASAAAIYGVRASNGVVLITTKKGKEAKPTVTFNSRFGLKNITKSIDVLNTQQYAKFVQDVYASDPTLSVDNLNAEIFDPANSRYLGNGTTYNWQEGIQNNNAPTQDYSLSLSGRTEKTNYYVSVGYQNAEGTFFMNHLERYSGSMNINSQVNDFLKLGINYRINTATGLESTSYSMINMARTPPWQPIYDTEGPFGYAGAVHGILPGSDAYVGDQKYGTGTRINELGILASNQMESTSTRNLGLAYVELKPFKNLTIEGKVSMDEFTQNYKEFRDSRAAVFDYTVGDPRALGGGNSAGTQDESTIYTKNMIKEITFNYSNTFGDHKIDVLFNAMDQQYERERTFITAEYSSTPLEYLRVYEGENQYSGLNSEKGRWALQGLLGRISYNYKSKYYIDLTTRRDGSARFSPDNRWGTFPAASLAWRLSSESFMEKLDWITDIKLRASWGQLGNQEVRNNAYLSTISTVPTFAWGNNPANVGIGNFSFGAATYGIPNTGLQWEKTTTTNLGFDAIIIDDLNVSFEYFNKLTDGILQEVSLPNSTGVLDQPVDNIASVRNSGVEFSLNYRNTIGDLVYNISGNFTTVKNVVKETYKHIPLWNIEEGYSMFYIKGYKVGGIFQSQEEVDAWKAQYSDANYQTSKVGPGDMYFQDIRSAPQNEGEFYSETPDGKVDNYDQVFLGKSIPGFFYGFNLNLEYKGFDFGTQFTGVGDVVKINQVRASMENLSSTGSNVSTAVYNAWTPANKSQTVPRLIGGDPADASRISDRFLESAAYLRLSYIELGYTLPANFYRWTKKNVSHTRVYAGVGNLFTLTKYSGLDPESDAYPTPLNIFMGLNVRF